MASVGRLEILSVAIHNLRSRGDDLPLPLLLTTFVLKRLGFEADGGDTVVVTEDGEFRIRVGPGILVFEGEEFPLEVALRHGVYALVGGLGAFDRGVNPKRALFALIGELRSYKRQ